MTFLQIHFDGGCNPNPGAMYGSYQLQLTDRDPVTESRMPLGHGTNNEAEFKTLIAAIKRGGELVDSLGLEKRLIRVEIVTDSKIVMNRVSGRKRNTPSALRSLAEKYGPKAVESAQRMDALAQECLKPLILFHSYTIKWSPRENNVARFGH